MGESDLSIDSGDIRKNGYGFSFLSTAISLVNNRNFKTGEFDIYQTDPDTGLLIPDTKDSYLWRTLSAVAEQIGGVMQENVANFVDNVSNIELCKIKALQSMSEFTGTKYSVFQNIIGFPRELLELMDILSIKREYLVNVLKVNEKFGTQMKEAVSAVSEAVCVQAEALSAARSINSSLSAKWASYYDSTLSAYVPYEVTSSDYMDEEKLDATISGIYRDFIVQKLEQTYNDEQHTIIWQQLSNEALLSGFKLPNDKAADIADYKLRYNVSKSFDSEAECDKLEAGVTELQDYTQYEQDILAMEKQRRAEPYWLSAMQTKNKYYREADVREYYKFVEDEYTQLCSTYLSANEYPVDTHYLQINDTKKDPLIILSVEGMQRLPSLDTRKIDHVVELITRLTSELRAIREQMKVICQKNCMKGTYVLISYIINEYLKNNLRYSLSSISPSVPEYDYSKNKVDFIEYVDPTEYFNISASVDTDQISGLNQRYWESSKGLAAIGAIDNTNIFQQLPTLDSNNFALGLDCISAFYLQILQNRFETDPDKTMPLSSQTQHLYDFLSAVFDIGADKTYRQSGELCSVAPDALSSKKADMFYSYMGLSDSAEPYCNIKNQRHPSYQIHPYLSNFMEYFDYSYPIENTVNIAAENVRTLLRDGLRDFIDADGYLTQLWHNPLNSNSDYQSRYEVVSHVDANNNQNAVYGYDGLFYPLTLNRLSGDPQSVGRFLSSVSAGVSADGNAECGYYGLDLTYSERAFIVSQISAFKDVILSCARSPYDVSRYGLDLYGNSYILVKNLGKKDIDDAQTVTQADRDAAAGTLWIRLKNHPLAFPAYVLSSEAGKCQSLLPVSQCYVQDENDKTANMAFISEQTKYGNMKDDYGGGNWYTPKVYDFQMSNDRTFAIIDVAVKRSAQDTGPVANWPLLVFPSRTYDTSLKRYTFKLERDGDTQALTKDGIQHNEGFEDYKRACWYKEGTCTGAAYWARRPGNKISFVMCGYDVQNADDQRAIGGIGNELTAGLSAEPVNGDVMFDTYYGSTDKQTHVVIAYVATRGPMPKARNYQQYEFDYDSLPACFRKFDKQVMTQDFVLMKRDPQTYMLSKPEEDTEHYLPYTQCGFNPAHQDKTKTKVNRYGDTELAKKDQRRIRGIAKFQFVGDPKDADEMIDFKFVIPVRMFDYYRVSEDLSAAELPQMHFGESDAERAAHMIQLGETSIYDPVEFKVKVKTSDLNINVDEEYVNFLADYGYGDDPVDDAVEYPYLWKYKQGEKFMDIPDKYVYAFSSSPELSWKDDICIKTSGNKEISASFGYNRYTQDIQIDFNSHYYFGRTSKDDVMAKNIFNRKHMFLNLDGPGAAGWLYTYDNDGDAEPNAKYYIKNISEAGSQKVKIILSSFFRDGDQPEVETALFATEPNTESEEGVKCPDFQIDVVYNNMHYDLATED